MESTTQNEDKITSTCPNCHGISNWELTIARYYVRSHDSVKCPFCLMKYKPYCLDEFQNLPQLPEQNLGIEAGKSQSTREEHLRANDLIVSALKNNGAMSMHELFNEVVNKQQVREKIFYQEFNRLRQTQIRELSSGSYSLMSNPL